MGASFLSISKYIIDRAGLNLPCDLLSLPMSEAKFTSEFLSKALKIQTRNNTFFQFDRIWTDSRTLKPTDFFVALPGEKFDGHDFIPQAVEKGVRGFLVREDYQHTHLNGCFVLRVPDTVKGFRKIAAVWRREFRIPVIAVAGSVGKTTAKEFLASLLSGKFQTAKTHGSQNGFIGIPMSLTSWDSGIQAAVVEIGIDDKGAMEDHLNIVHPTHGLITALGPEHLEQLGDVEGVFQEETKLISYLKRSGGAFFLNWDEPLLRERFHKDKHILTFSLEDPQADFFGAILDRRLTVSHGKTVVKIPLPLPGIHNARNLLGAAAIAIVLGLIEGEMAEGLTRFQTPSYRMEIRGTPHGIQLLCDYYNANPTSMEGAFQVLEGEFSGNGKILVLGDMLELGVQSAAYHRGLAASIERLKPKGVYLFGSEMRALEEELGERKVAFPVVHFEDKEKLAKALWLAAQPGDAVLVKGSRGMKMEEILKDKPVAYSR